MSKLFKLKKWMTVADTAKFLSINFGEEVTEAEVLRLALDEKLKMSVHLVDRTEAKRAEKISIPEDLTHIPGFTYGDWMFTVQADEIIYLVGVLDLPMIGTERLLIEEKYHLSLTGDEWECISPGSIYVEADGQLYVLQQSFADPLFVQCDEEDGLEEVLKESAKNNYFDAQGFPNDSRLVVRTTAIQEFLERALEPDKPMEKLAIRLIEDAEREGDQLPEELDIAMIAWRAACNGIKQGEKPGAFIRDWLAKNYPALSDEARKRIGIVANWDKTPGAGKKSPGQ